MTRTAATPDVGHFGAELEQDLGNISGAVTIDFALGMSVYFTLVGNVTFTFTNWPNTPANRYRSRAQLWAKQDATGGRIIAWPAAVSWGTAGTPTLSAAGLVDAFILSSKTGNPIFGFITGYGF